MARPEQALDHPPMPETYSPVPSKRCPRDSAILATDDVGGYRYYSCLKCLGCWIPGSALRKTMRLGAARDIIETLPWASSSALPCPNGDGALATVIVRACEIDICPRCHSLWLDHREAVAIANCFREPSPIVEADRANSPNAIPASAFVFEAIGTMISLIFR